MRQLPPADETDHAAQPAVGDLRRAGERRAARHVAYLQHLEDPNHS
jgi:hypothetical protein